MASRLPCRFSLAKYIANCSAACCDALQRGYAPTVLAVDSFTASGGSFAPWVEYNVVPAEAEAETNEVVVRSLGVIAVEIEFGTSTAKQLAWLLAESPDRRVWARPAWPLVHKILTEARGESRAVILAALFGEPTAAALMAASNAAFSRTIGDTIESKA